MTQKTPYKTGQETLEKTLELYPEFQKMQINSKAINALGQIYSILKNCDIEPQEHIDMLVFSSLSQIWNNKENELYNIKTILDHPNINKNQKTQLRNLIGKLEYLSLSFAFDAINKIKENKKQFYITKITLEQEIKEKTNIEIEAPETITAITCRLQQIINNVDNENSAAEWMAEIWDATLDTRELFRTKTDTIMFEMMNELVLEESPKYSEYENEKEWFDAQEQWLIKTEKERTEIARMRIFGGLYGWLETHDQIIKKETTHKTIHENIKHQLQSFNIIAENVPYIAEEKTKCLTQIHDICQKMHEENLCKKITEKQIASYAVALILAGIYDDDTDPIILAQAALTPAFKENYNLKYLPVIEYILNYGADHYGYNNEELEEKLYDLVHIGWRESGKTEED